MRGGWEGGVGGSGISTSRGGWGGGRGGAVKTESKRRDVERKLAPCLEEGAVESRRRILARALQWFMTRLAVLGQTEADNVTCSRL